MATIFDRVVNYKEKAKPNESAPKPATVQPSTKGGVLVYMKVSVGKRNVGRMVFELFYDETPKTAENFRVLCTGERGLSPISGKPLHYKGSTFHRIIRGFMAQGGDFTHGNGTGGESIYGSKFADEDFTRKHTEPGLLSMANAGPNTNGSQFFVTFQHTPHLDDKHVVFGKLVEGKHVLSALEVVATTTRDKPRMAVTITDCGQLSEGAGPEDEDEAQEKSQEQTRQVEPKKRESGMSQAEMSMAIVSGLQSFAGRGRKAKRRKTRPREDDDDEEEEVAQPPHSVVVASSAPTSAAATEQVKPAAVRKLTPRELKLQELREKMGQARHHNKQATRLEYKKVSDPNYEKKRKREEWLEYKKRKQRDMEKRGRTEADDYLDKSATQLGRVYRQQEEKAQNRAAFGWNVFNQDTIHKANTKRLNSLPHRGDEGNVVKDLSSMGGPHTSKAAVRELSKAISAQEEKRKKFSRRRRHNPDADVNYINDRNAHFNKKIGRAFDKYTVEIRQNLERGTAL